MKTLILTTAALLAAPALAQTAPAAAPTSADAKPKAGAKRMHHPMLFGNVSPEGRAILRETMRSNPEDRTALRATRDRINDIVGAEKLDVNALKRAMDDERRLIDSQHAKRQAALLAAIQKLSPADRKAFAEDARKGRDEIEARVKRWHENNPAQRPERPTRK